MEPLALIAAARAAGATLQPEGVFVRAVGLAALPPPLREELRRHRDQVHTWLCAETAVLPDRHDDAVRRELAEPEGRPGAGYRPGDPDGLRDGLGRGFTAHHLRSARAPRAAPAGIEPARQES